MWKGVNFDMGLDTVLVWRNEGCHQVRIKLTDRLEGKSIFTTPDNPFGELPMAQISRS